MVTVFFRKAIFNSNEKKQRYLLQYKCATQQQLLPVQLFGQSLQIVSYCIFINFTTPFLPAAVTVSA